ncbi:Circularly permutated Ras protein 1 [Holothuria leucospilota]|uniref:Circularly permutated Ras protein 1 n=1 Tax=Holothuria leucospilota TaxID=206669 RepID=A0A9Q1H253_HOLLE|nr:Circularly permutated Ras protein 1 [Holothuria leucospilota]
MEFASSHVLNYDESDEEEIDDNYMKGTFALYQGLMVDNVMYGGIQPVTISGSSASADYDNPGFRKQGKSSAAPSSDDTYDNAIFDSSRQGQHTGPDGQIYDNAIFGKSAGGARLGYGSPVYDNPEQSVQQKLMPDEAYYDNPKMPKKTRKKIPVPWKSKNSQSQSQSQSQYYTSLPPVYTALGEGTGNQQQPPPLPPMRKPSQDQVASDYDYVGLRKDSKKVRRADTNIVAVKFDALAKPSQVQQGKPIICERCSAMLSHVSNVVEDDRGIFWKCEYCDLGNILSQTDADLPRHEDMTYVLSPGSESGDDTAIIFCVDISGSMAVTSEVPSGPNMRQNSETAARNLYHQEFSSTPQSPTLTEQIPNFGVSYVSRLQAMQSAIDEQLTKLEEVNPNKRVGIVAFNDTVTIIGDGTSPPIPLEGAGLTDFQSLTGLGTAMPLPLPVAEVKRCISDKVFSLTEGGQTALGPALLISVAMASQKAGSKVLICTDGLANVGMGLMQGVDDDVYQESVAFFEDVGFYARDSGVCVSVLTMEGEDCRVIELGNVADKTGGRVTVVDPLKLNETFGDVVHDSILATNVSAKMVLHRGLYFREDENEKCYINRNVGNVRADTEATFEFGVRRTRQKEVLYDNGGGTTFLQSEDDDDPIYDSVGAQQSMINGIEELPFQVQISYTGRDGGQYIRVITMNRPVTKDREFAEQNANVAIVGAHAAQNAAKLAVEGDFGQAQMSALVTQKLVERYAGQRGDDGEEIYGAYVASVAPMHHEINQAQKRELLEMGEYLSDIEEDEEIPAIQEKGEARGKKRVVSMKKKQRRKNISDRTASIFYKMKAATSHNFAAAI